MQELVPGSGVQIRKMQLMHAVRAAKSGTHLIRNLMDVFWTREQLAKSSVSGGGGYFEPLPQEIVKAIEGKYIIMHD